LLGTFTEPDTSDASTEFSVAVNWGDGSSPGTATVTGSDGNFQISGSHSYSGYGDFPVNVTVSQNWGLFSAPAASKVLVAQAPAQPVTPTAEIQISSSKTNAIPTWPVGRIANPQGWGYGVTVSIETNTPIKTWTITQKVFQLIGYTGQQNVFQVTDGDHKDPTIITPGRYDNLLTDYDDSTWKEPKVTFAPDGPNQINANPPKAWFDWGANSVKYWDAPGSVGKVNGNQFNKGMDATKVKGIWIDSIAWLIVTASSGGISYTNQFAVRATFTSNGTTFI
jgi:hypothetical protein